MQPPPGLALNDTLEQSPTEAVQPVVRLRAHALPQQPVAVIKPSRGFAPIDFRELWAFRDLLYLLVLREVQVRYKQAALGVGWAVIQPLFSMLVFTVFFGKLAKVPSDGSPYALFSFAGLLPWTYFANAVTNGSNSLVGNANLLTKVYFPRLLIPLAAVCGGLIDFAIAFGLFLLLALYYGVPLGFGLLWVLPLVACTVLAALGIALWMSALNVKYRDVRYALPFFIQLGLFLSPVIYPVNMLPERWRWLIALNPMAGVIEGFRCALLGGQMAWSRFGVSILSIALILLYSAFTFRKMERRFADVV